MNKRDTLKYVGDLSQLFGVKDYHLIGGRAEGVRAVDIKNGSGLELTVLPDRGLNIAYLSYKSMNLSYISKTGIVAPQYYNDSGLKFLRSFFGGFLTTCGLRQAGSPCVDQGEELGLHGRIANIPAEETYAGTEFIQDTAVMKVRGKVREAAVFGENIVLEREITVPYGENKFIISDNVENQGFRDEPLMILYHCNLGYPLLTSKSYFISRSKSVHPRDEEAAKGINDYKKFQLPTPDYKEQVFYHQLNCDNEGRTFAALINPIQEIGLAIWFNKNQLWNLTQWKQMGEGEYVLGIEPGNCHVGGRSNARKDGTLEFIKQGEVRNFKLEVEIIEGQEEIRKLEELANLT